MGRLVTQAPRAPQPTLVSKAAQRIQTNRMAALQQSVYTPQAFVRPQTMDASNADATAVSVVGPAWSGFYLMRLKGVVGAQAWDSVLVTGVSAGTYRLVAAVCEYNDDTQQLSVREVVRGVSNSSRLVRLQSPVTLYPDRKYALAIGADVDAASTLDLYGSPTGVVIRAGGIAQSGRVDMDWDGTNVSGGIETQGSPTATPVFALMLSSSESTGKFNISTWY